MTAGEEPENYPKRREPSTRMITKSSSSNHAMATHRPSHQSQPLLTRMNHRSSSQTLSSSTQRPDPPTLESTTLSESNHHHHKNGPGATSIRKRRKYRAKRGPGFSTSWWTLSYWSNEATSTMTTSEGWVGILALVLAVLYLYFLWRSQALLDVIEKQSSESSLLSLSLRINHPDLPLLPNRHHRLAVPDQPNMTSKALAQPPAARWWQRFSLSKTASSWLRRPQPPLNSSLPAVFEKFLIFEPFREGQGVGNIISGLLAAHLLGVEFNRTVCILDYREFDMAFEDVDPVRHRVCQHLLQRLHPTKVHHNGSDSSAQEQPEQRSNYLQPGKNQVILINFVAPPDECMLRNLLLGNESVLYYIGNTYPRWPAVPDNFFFQFYQPTDALLHMLPYRQYPKTVVHLRQPDHAMNDGRKGLDTESLEALGQMLQVPSNQQSPNEEDRTYLVTNRVEWYDYFEKNFRWNHPSWEEVVHSANNGFSWGRRHETFESMAYIRAKDQDKDRQTMQTWADWYTILKAKTVYHTHSDFSQSAIHWMNIESSSIQGYDASEHALKLERESWRVDGETARLIDRTVDGAGTSALRLCQEDAFTIQRPVPRPRLAGRERTEEKSAKIDQEEHRQEIPNPQLVPPLLKVEPNERSTAKRRFIVFQPIGAAQGVGNIVNGLLAAHLLGEEFQRTVCVDPIYESFLNAFEPIDPVVLKDCPTIHDGSMEQMSSDRIEMVTFREAPDECELKEKLSSDTRVLYITSNTYPRWPSVPKEFFTRFYRAKDTLLKLLPYEKAPSTVVHLRQPDNIVRDHREGLDEESLTALGEMLPNNTYLVTNRVEWYDHFERRYGWSHPDWDEVVHTALGRAWGRRHATFRSKAFVEPVDSDSARQMMQTWADWYTILMAKKVYHTHSDFSCSAVHWMNSDSYTIAGYDGHSRKLKLLRESWLVDGETAPLVNRTWGGPGTSALRKCKSPPKEEPRPEVQGVPPPMPNVPKEERFLIFHKLEEGQGFGNILNGLLAAHLLGLEFNRTVCVDDKYEDFHMAFELINMNTLAKCVALLADQTQTDTNSLHLVNYYPAPNECKLQERLASKEAVLYFVGNTYPRWPSVPDNFFFRFYKAKKEVLDILPYQSAPETVVHLRQPDLSDEDTRKGLDEESLNALGRLLPRETYLVTNRVEWYEKFEKEYGWMHPNWDEVVHSALDRSWGRRNESFNSSTFVEAHDRDKRRQTFQTWADWYTLLRAKKVYHTHSDFSCSAVHWMNIDSRSINGMDQSTGQLDLRPESWRFDGETAPVVERYYRPGTEDRDTRALRRCNYTDGED